MDTIERDGITYRTEYVGERQTIRIERDGQRLGTVQSTRTGAWIPAKRDGMGPDDLPPMSAGRFTNPQDAIAWVLAE